MAFLETERQVGHPRARVVGFDSGGQFEGVAKRPRASVS